MLHRRKISRLFSYRVSPDLAEPFDLIDEGVQ
jgi:hypothetical protein